MIRCSFVDLSAVCHVFSRALQLSRFHPFSPPIRRIIIDFPCEKEKKSSALLGARNADRLSGFVIHSHWGTFISDVHGHVDRTIFMMKSLDLNNSLDL